jgi:hypothetical protein
MKKITSVPTTHVTVSCGGLNSEIQALGDHFVKAV